MSECAEIPGNNDSTGFLFASALHFAVTLSLLRETRELNKQNGSAKFEFTCFAYDFGVWMEWNKRMSDSAVTAKWKCDTPTDRFSSPSTLHTRYSC